MTRTWIFLLLFLLPAITLAEDSPAAPPSTENTTPASANPSETAATDEEGSKDIRYVDDMLVIVMRSGNGNNFKIIRNLPSGTPLELLETSGEFSRVRTRSGTEGWVLSQYLTKEPIARVKLKAATQLITKVQAQNQQLKKELNDTTRENAKLGKENRKLTDQLRNFRSVAAKPIQIQEENQSLIKTNVSLENDKQMLQQELQVLRDQSDKRWFLAGAGVLLCGMLLGLLIPKMRRRRKSDWSSL